jgi:hypothetical protein
MFGGTGRRLAGTANETIMPLSKNTRNAHRRTRLMVVFVQSSMKERPGVPLPFAITIHAKKAGLSAGVNFLSPFV